MKRLDLIEMPGHVGLLALGQDWMTERHFADLMTACYLAMDLSEPGSEMHALGFRGGQLLADKSTEYDEIRTIVGTIVQWISKQPNTDIWHAAYSRLSKDARRNFSN